ncbi:exopolysaccharide biosynthesis protein [Burkholderia ubonensis]|nr:exopolysaccharide biosynthesis protein [Burkholderia ubonensis]PAJ93092.1 exopolysaccharide biosynthesis protein [Burkholderia ubonensis]PAK05543.1 exopolysaccharide biosynthesis protein [Burkholderia ubonensis]RQP68276.1 exopolysaccharide biosynthesis protein [Burkholderia ubonensis]RQP84875.1 exopolysaccharide biosynthesis protein [Burkholderia ubonensis]
MRRFSSILFPKIVMLVLMLDGCSTSPGNYLNTTRLDDSATPQGARYKVQLVTGELIISQAKAQQAMELPRLPVSRYRDLSQYVYRIEPQDILGVIVWDHPELTTPQSSGVSSTTQTIESALQQPYTSGLSNNPSGQTVDADGSIYFPYVGKLFVAGKTIGETRNELSKKLARYVMNPQVDVRVLAYRSQKIQVTGEVKAPGPLTITDVPLTLVDAIARSGGASTEADLQRVRLTRDGQFYVLDAYGILDRGDIRQNVILQSGDILNIPDRTDSRVFVMGEVKTPVTASMNKGHLTIADALTAGGGILDTDANPRQVYVLRTQQDKPDALDIFRLDMTQPDTLMLSSRFQLKPLDVVYVGTAGSVYFNRLLQQIFPTIQSVYYMKQIRR